MFFCGQVSWDDFWFFVPVVDAIGFIADDNVHPQVVRVVFICGVGRNIPPRICSGETRDDFSVIHRPVNRAGQDAYA